MLPAGSSPRCPRSCPGLTPVLRRKWWRSASATAAQQAGLGGQCVRTAAFPEHEAGACSYPKLPGAADCQIP